LKERTKHSSIPLTSLTYSVWVNLGENLGSVSTVTIKSLQGSKSLKVSSLVASGNSNNIFIDKKIDNKVPRVCENPV